MVYGRPLRYVVSLHAGAISRLTGRTTLSDHDIWALTELGFEIQEVTR